MNKRNGTLKRITAFLLSVSMALTMFNVTDLPLINNGGNSVTASAEEETVTDADQKRFWDGTAARMFYSNLNDQFGGVKKRTTVFVYAKAGETIEFGSNVYNATTGYNASGDLVNNGTVAYGGDDGDILLHDLKDKIIEFNVEENGAGHINSLAKEQQAMRLDEGDDYKPLTYTVTETGVYSLDFMSRRPSTYKYYTDAGLTTAKSSVDKNILNNAAAYSGTYYYRGTDGTTQSTSNISVFDPDFNPGWIAAWSVNVKGEDGQYIYGRTYADQLSIQTQGTINERFFVLTNDNYLYKVEYKGLNPYTGTFFANNRGVLDTATGNILYKSVKDVANNITFGRMGVKYKMPESSDTDLSKTFKIFFEHPNPDLKGILYDDAILPDPATDLTFSGADENGKVYAGEGGYFSFNVEEATTATVRVKFSDTKYTTAEITDIVTPHTINSFYWDGKDGSGEIVPAGTTITYSVVTKAGEIHFPMIDVECAPKGITITRESTLHNKDGSVVADEKGVYAATKNVVYYDETAIYYGENAASTGWSEGNIQLTNSGGYKANQYTVRDALDGNDNKSGTLFSGDVSKIFKTDETFKKNYFVFNNYYSEQPLYEERCKLGGEYPKIRFGDHSHTNNPIDYFDKTADEQKDIIDYLDSSKHPVGISSASSNGNQVYGGSSPYWGSTTDYAVANYWTFIPAREVSADEPITTKPVETDKNVFTLRGFVFFDEEKGTKGVYEPLSDGDHALNNVTLNVYKQTEDKAATGDKTYYYYKGGNIVSTTSPTDTSEADGGIVYELVRTAATTLTGDYFFTGLEYDKTAGTPYMFEVVRPDNYYTLTSGDKSPTKAGSGSATGPYDLYATTDQKGVEIQRFKVGGTGIDPSKDPKNLNTITATNVGYYFDSFKDLTINKVWEVNGDDWSIKPVVSLEVSYTLEGSADDAAYDWHNISQMEQNSYSYPYLPSRFEEKDVQDYAVTAEYFVFNGAAYKFTFDYDPYRGIYNDFIGTPYYFIIDDSNGDGQYDINDLEKDASTSENKVDWAFYNGESVKEGSKNIWKEALTAGTPEGSSGLTDKNKGKDIAPVVATIDYQHPSAENIITVTNSSEDGVIEVTKADSTIVDGDKLADGYDPGLLLEGATFRLYRLGTEADIEKEADKDLILADPAAYVKSKVADNDTRWLNSHFVADAGSRNNGMLAFTSIDTDQYYVLRELFAPDKYRKSVAYEYITVKPTDFDDDHHYQLVIPNTIADDNLTIRKVLSGRGWATADKFDFNIRLDSYELSTAETTYSEFFSKDELGDLQQFRDKGIDVSIDNKSPYLVTSTDEEGAPLSYNRSVKTVSTEVTANDFSWGGAAKDSDSDRKVTFPYPGTFTFVITEKAGSNSSIAYDSREYKVTIDVGVLRDVNGQPYETEEEILSNLNPVVGDITADGESRDAVQFRNTYSVADRDLTTSYHIDVTLTGRDPGNQSKDSWLESDQFNFTVAGKDSDTINALKNGDITIGIDTAALDDDGKYELAIGESTTSSAGTLHSLDFEDIKFENVTFDTDEGGSTKPRIYNFEIKQNIPIGVDANNVLNGIKYDDIVYTLKAELTDDGEGNIGKVVFTVTNNKDDTSYVCTVEYGSDGEKHTHNEAGHVFKFSNTYSTSAEWYLNISKTLTGRAWHTADSFTFTIARDYIGTGANANMSLGYGGVALPSVRMVTIGNDSTKAGDDGTGRQAQLSNSIRFTKSSGSGYYRFTIRETKTTTGGITDAEPITLFIKAADDTLGGITLTYAVKTGTGSSVTAPLSREYKTLDNNVVFNFINTYSENGTLTLDIEKTLRGRAWTNSDIFTFDIDDSDNKDGGYTLTDGKTISVTPAKDEDGSIIGGDTHSKQSNIVFNKEGDYTFTVSERSGSDNIVYDPTKYTITAKVEKGYDTGAVPNGTLNVSASYVVVGASGGGTDKDGTVTLPFTNKAYAEAKLELNKTLYGRDWNSVDKFDVNIKLTSENGENAVMLSDGSEKPFTDDYVTQTAALTDSGRSIEKTLRFYKEGTYTFEITEKLPDGGKKDNVTYDNNTYTLTVTVTDNGEGELVADCKIDGGETGNRSATGSTASVTFVNTYSAVGYVRINKTLSGRREEKPWDKEDVGGINDNFNFTADPDAAAKQAIDTGLLTLRDDGKVPINAYDEQNGSTQSRFDYLYIYAQGLTFTDGQPGYVNADGGYYEYKFTITEDSSEPIAGITYDESKYTVTVKITKNSDNTFKIEPVTVQKDGDTEGTAYNKESSVLFENTYTAKGTADFNVSKTLTGREWITGDEFNFTITEDTGNPAKAVITTDPATAEDEPGNISITLDKPGEYNFTVTEKNSGETIPGITYDTSEYKVTLTATDNDDGTLNITSAITKDGESAAEISFTNSYSAKGTYQIRVHKELTGREDNKWLESDKFSYSFSTEATPNVTAENEKIEIGSTPDTHNGVFNISLNDVTFDGGVSSVSYTVTVIEDIPDGDKKGITYDNSTYEITLKIEEKDFDGVITDDEITAEVQCSDTSRDVDAKEDGYPLLNFVNSYKAEGAVLSFDVTKKLEGRPWATDDSFEFSISSVKYGGTEIKDDDMSGYIDTSDGTHSIDSSNETKTVNNSVTFLKAGKYEFTFGEVLKSGVGLTCADPDRKFEVVVEDNNEGKLVIKSVTIDGESVTDIDDIDLEFVNRYSASGTLSADSITVLATLTGRPENKWLDKDIFTFNIEQIGELVGTVTLPGSIEISGKTDEHTKGFGEIKFENVTFDDDGNPAVYQFKVSQKYGGNTIAGVNYDPVEYTVTVSLTDDTKGGLKAEVTKVEKTADGPVSAAAISDEDMPLEFNNVYYTDEFRWKPTVSKVLNGRDWCEDDSFDFNITLTDGNPDGVYIPESKVTIDDSETPGYNAAFETITFSKPGTYTFEISESKSGTVKGITYDKSQTVTIEVMDDDEGNLVTKMSDTYVGNISTGYKFTNSYAASGKLDADSIKVIKQLIGRDWNNGDEFTFTIKAPSEINAGDKITLPDNVVINNGSDIYGEDGRTKGFGEISFDNITFAAGERQKKYIFTIAEEGEDSNGVKYDTTEIAVEVTLTDNLDGTLSVSGGEEVTFTNEYTASAATLNRDSLLTVHKTLVGRQEDIWLNTDSFGFTIEPYDDITKQACDDKDILFADNDITISGDGKSGEKTGKFGDITFNKAGTYVFEISEQSGGIEGITYDDTIYYLTVQVIDNRQGNLKFLYGKLTDKNGKNVSAISFENVYNTKGSWTPKSTKTLNGRDWNEKDSFGFNIELKSFNGGDVPEDMGYSESITLTGITAASGTKYDLPFSDITFTKPGEYLFSITEDIPGGADENNVYNGIKYDDTKYLVTVTVTDDLKGKLTAKSDISADFINTYSASGKIALPVTKTFIGRANNEWFKSDEFGFNAVAYNAAAKDAVLAEKMFFTQLTLDGKTAEVTDGTASGNIGIELENIEFAAGENSIDYEFTVKEKQGGIPGITYDDREYHAYVTVTDNTDGTLDISVSYKLEEEVDGIEFINVYSAKPAAVEFDIEKTLNGRPWQEFDSFDFELAGENIPEVDIGTITDKSESSGNSRYQKFGFEVNAGDGFSFTVTEKVPEDKLGLTYSDKEYTVTVAGTDNTKGQTVAEVIVTDKDNILYSFDTSEENVPKAVLSFVNSYEPVLVSDLLPKISKTLNGRRWLSTDKFTFDVDINGEGEYVKLPEEVVVTGEGVPRTQNTVSAELGSVTFSPNGEKETLYKFIISEKDEEDDENNNIYSVSYDKSEYIAEVLFTDDFKGDLTAKLTKLTKKTASDGTESGEVLYSGSGDIPTLNFENIYTASGTWPPVVKKTLTGRDFDEQDKFVFHISLEKWPDNVNRDEVGMPDDLVIQLSDGVTDGYITKAFDAVEFSKPGEYVFSVTEKTDVIRKGVDYDKTKYQIILQVTDEKHDGVLSYEPENVTVVNEDGTQDNYSNTETLDFENVYNANGSWSPVIRKTLTGRKWQSFDKFEFTLTLDKAQGADKSTVTYPESLVIANKDGNSNSYTEVFDNAAEFTKPGIFTFTIEEKAGEENNGIDYDSKHKYTVNVTVTDDNNDGVLTVKADNTEALEFENSYSAAGIWPPKVTKTLTGRKWDGEYDEYSFGIKLDKAPDGVDINGFVLPADLVITKGEQDAESYTGQFDNVVFSTPGEYVFSIVEKNTELGGISYDDSVYTLTVYVLDEGNGHLEPEVTEVRKNGEAIATDSVLEFTNEYYADTTLRAGTLRIRKLFTGRDWLESDKFGFVLTPADEVTKQAVTDKLILLPDNASGMIIGKDTDNLECEIGDITFKSNGEEKRVYTFTVTEKDMGLFGVEYAEPVDIKVTVTDDMKGSLTVSAEGGRNGLLIFRNVYSASGEAWPPKVNAKLVGRDWTDKDSFTYEITLDGVSEGVDIDSVTLPPDITVKKGEKQSDSYGLGFDQVIFNHAGLYTFTVKQKSGNTPGGVEYSAQEYTIELYVSDDNKGHLSAEVVKITDKDGNVYLEDELLFENTYSTRQTLIGEEELTVTKNLSGRDWKTGDVFAFELSQLSGPKEITVPVLLIEGRDGEKGAISGHFEDITFTEPGEYRFEVKETGGTSAGITFDKNTYTITVLAEDNGDGSMTLTVSGNDDISFTNTYKAAPVTVKGDNFTITKSLSGREWKAEDSFEFTVTDSDTLSGEIITISGSDSEKSKHLSDMEFTEPGDHSYNVTETKGTDENITYDDKSYSFNVKVTDDGNGKLSAQISGDTEMLFTNVYNEPQTSGPETSAPVSEPETSAPVSEPETSAPTSEPETSAPTSEPETSAPTSEPETGAPTSEPETGAPTSEPETGAPTSEPETGAPTSEPETSAPTSEPETGKSADTGGDATVQPDDKDNNPDTGIRLDVTAALITGSAFSLTAIVFRRKSKKDKK